MNKPESTAIKEIHRKAETLAATTCSIMAATPEVPPESSGEDELKKKRTVLRRKVSGKRIAVENLVAKEGPRTLIREYMAELRTLLTAGNEVNEKVCDLYATDTEFEEQARKSRRLPGNSSSTPRGEERRRSFDRPPSRPRGSAYTSDKDSR